MTMTSRQRMLAALSGQKPDYVPCSFMLFKGLWNKSATYLDFIQKQLDLGLDPFVQIPPRTPGQVSDCYNRAGIRYIRPNSTQTAGGRERLVQPAWIGSSF